MMLNSLKKGFSLVELLLVLGVVATLLVAAFFVYPKIRANAVAKKELDNISMITAGVSNVFKGRSNFSKLNNQLVINAKIVPSAMKDPSGTDKLINSWGGSVELKGVPEYNNTQYWITYQGVPQDACQTFAQGLLNTAVALNVGGIQVSFNNDPTGGWKAREVRIENIGTGCNTAANVTIVAQYEQ